MYIVFYYNCITMNRNKNLTPRDKLAALLAIISLLSVLFEFLSGILSYMANFCLKILNNFI